MKSCSFTGHRPEKIWDLKVGRITEEKVKAVIRETVIMLVQDGVRTFYSGMARGTDMWDAEVVIELQKTYHDIELIAVKPFPEQTDMSWPEQEKIKYQDLLSKCTEVKVICPVYEKEAYKKETNIWLTTVKFWWPCMIHATAVQVPDRQSEWQRRQNAEYYELIQVKSINRSERL